MAAAPALPSFRVALRGGPPEGVFWADVGNDPPSRINTSQGLARAIPAGRYLDLRVEFKRGWHAYPVARAFLAAVLAHAERVVSIEIGACPSTRETAETTAVLGLLQACTHAYSLTLPVVYMNFIARFEREVLARGHLPRMNAIDVSCATSAAMGLVTSALLRREQRLKHVAIKGARVYGWTRIEPAHLARLVSFVASVCVDARSIAAEDEAAFADAVENSRTIQYVIVHMPLAEREASAGLVRRLVRATHRSRADSVRYYFGDYDYDPALKSANDRGIANRQVMALYSAGIARLGAGSPAAAKFVQRDGDTAIGHRITEFLIEVEDEEAMV